MVKPALAHQEEQSAHNNINKTAVNINPHNIETTNVSFTDDITNTNMTLIDDITNNVSFTDDITNNVSFTEDINNNVYRLTHDQSFIFKGSNTSVNSRLDKTELSPCIFGWQFDI